MNISNTAKGLFIGGLIFVGIFFSIVVASKQARAQAQVEEAQAKAHQAEALRAQADEARAQAEELRARAEMSKKQMEDSKKSTQQNNQSIGRFQIVPWNTNLSHGAYILETDTGKVFAVDGSNKPTLIGQAQ